MIEDDEPIKHKITIPKLKIRSAYQVGYQIYKTPRSAASKVAWNWIMTKYGNQRGNRLENVIRVAGLECECSNDEFGYPDDSCCIHDRGTGYFRRLHRKCVDAILKEWNK